MILSIGRSLVGRLVSAAGLSSGAAGIRRLDTLALAGLSALHRDLYTLAIGADGQPAVTLDPTFVARLREGKNIKLDPAVLAAFQEQLEQEPSLLDRILRRKDKDKD